MTRLWEEVRFEPPEPAELFSREQADTEQAEVIFCDRWPCAIHAGPGAGKTWTLVNTVARLARELHTRLGKEAQGAILVLTFTNAGRDVLRRRLARADLPRGVVRVHGTQELCWMKYRECHHGHKRLSVGEQRELLAKAIGEAGADMANLESVIRVALASINELAALPSFVCEVVTPAVLEAYSAGKAAVSGYDDGDVRRWIVEHGHSIVAGWARQKARVILLEEAQDSSPPEAALLKAAEAAGLKVGYVCDLRQLLYGFRGATPELLIDALRAAAGFHVHALRVNRRAKAIPVGELNRFSAWAFEGIEAEPTYALEPGGEPFRAVECPEQSAVLEVLPQALAAVGGLVRDRSVPAPHPDTALARALGLPERLDNGQSLLLEVANRKDADELERVLGDWGYLPVMLVRRDDAPALLDMLHGIVDPEGHTGGPATWYGAASPLCLVLNALRYRPDLKMRKESDEAKAVDRTLASLRRRQAAMSFDELIDHARRTLRELPSWPGSRLSAYCREAVRLLDEWARIRGAERQGHLPALEVLQRLLALAPQSARGKTGDLRAHPLLAYLESACASRREAARRITEWIERPALGKVDDEHYPDSNEPPVLYVAVVNQVKGDEADYAVIVALERGRFPYHGIDAEGERRRWWVAISRARSGTSYLGVAGNSLYWPPLRGSRPE